MTPVSPAIAQLHPSGELRIRGPFGCGWPPEAIRGEDILIVAGGLGCVQESAW
jgi:sulfhydrogenase subunit gamma (sulfur reductase)